MVKRQIAAAYTEPTVNSGAIIQFFNTNLSSTYQIYHVALAPMIQQLKKDITTPALLGMRQITKKV